MLSTDFFKDTDNIDPQRERTTVMFQLMQLYRVLEWLQSFAAIRDLEWKQDKEGNMVIFRPGSNGGENARPVIVQVLSSRDMRCITS